MGFGFEEARGARRWVVGGGGNGGRGSAWREGVRCGGSGPGRERREEDGDNARILFRDFSTDAVTDRQYANVVGLYVNRKAPSKSYSKTLRVNYTHHTITCQVSVN